MDDSKRDGKDKGFSVSVQDSYVLIRVNPGQVLTASLAETMLRDVYALDAYRTEKVAGLWDFRGCSSDLHYEDMRRIRQHVDAHYDSAWTQSLTAIVVDKDVLFGLARMYESLTEHIPTEVRIFKDMQAAEQWIEGRIAAGA